MKSDQAEAHPAGAVPPQPPGFRYETGIFLAGLACLLAGVLALPVFPSGDGAVHLYLAHILYLLASHQGGIYGRVYSIRHLVQPYSLHYLWLVGVGSFVSTAVAEKLFVAAILVCNAFGFRALAGRLGSSAPSVSLWILPLLLSWALGSGFFNFCFAAGLMFFAYTLYLRLCPAVRLAPLSLYVLVLLLLVLSHPVPLMMLILLLVGDTVLLLWGRKTLGSRTSFAPQVICLGLALLALVFPLLIADKSSVADSLLRDLRPHLAQLAAIASGDRLSLFFSASPAGILFTIVLVAVAPAGIAISADSGAFGRIRNETASPADRLCLVAVCLLLSTIIFPESMNGSALFADRMVPLLWPMLFAGAAAVPFSPGLRRWSALLATAATVASFTFLLIYLRPIARQQQALAQASVPRDARGLFIAAPPVRRPTQAHLADTLLAWGGARTFAANNDILLNTPWMQLTILPVRETGGGGLLRDTLPGSLSEDPVALGQWLRQRSPASALVMQHADFLLFSAPAASSSAVRSFLPQDSRDWQCNSTGFYAVCTRKTSLPGLDSTQ